MCSVNNYNRFFIRLRNQFESSRLQGFCHSSVKIFPAYLYISSFFHDAQGTQSHHGIFHLMASSHGNFYITKVNSLYHRIESTAFRSFLCDSQRYSFRFKKHGAFLLSFFTNNPQRSYVFGTGYYRTSFFDYSCLFSCNLLYGSPKPVHVIHGYRGYYGHQRFSAHIGGISRSAQSYLQNHIVTVLFFKIHKGNSRNHFKFRRRPVPALFYDFHSLKHGVRKPVQFIIGYIVSVKFNSLVELFQKRGCI